MTSTPKSPEQIVEEFNAMVEAEEFETYLHTKETYQMEYDDIADFLRSAMASAIAWAASEAMPKEVEITDKDGGYVTGITQSGERLSNNKIIGYERGLSDYHKALIKLSEEV